jgi:hypothetical protein
MKKSASALPVAVATAETVAKDSLPRKFIADP